MYSWIRNVAGGAAGVVVITYVWWLNSAPHPAPVHELSDLAASPLCLTAAGQPRPGSPTIEAAWERLTGRHLAQGQPRYLGDRSIEVQYMRDGILIPVGFIRAGDAGAHRWRPAQQAAAMDWADSVCGTSR